MTAERLRQASARLRGVAEAASGGRWVTVGSSRMAIAPTKFSSVSIGGFTDPADSEYAATMAPPVALALAAILEDDADGLGSYADQEGDESDGFDLFVLSLRLADAILGDA